jgi:hypothetical protein
MISAAYKIEASDEFKLPLTEPNISFVGRISSEQIDNDCRFGVDLLEYNNFNFGIQVVFGARTKVTF